MKSFDGKNGDISSGRGVWVNQKSRAHLHKMKRAWISRNCQLIDKLKLQIDGAYFSGYFSTSFHFTISNNDFSRCHCVILIMLNVSEGNKTSDKVYLWWNDQINIFLWKCQLKFTTFIPIMKVKLTGRMKMRKGMIQGKQNGKHGLCQIFTQLKSGGKGRQKVWEKLWDERMQKWSHQKGKENWVIGICAWRETRKTWKRKGGKTANQL